MWNIIDLIKHQTNHKNMQKPKNSFGFYPHNMVEESFKYTMWILPTSDILLNTQQYGAIYFANL